MNVFQFVAFLSRCRSSCNCCFFFFASFSILDVGMNCCLWLFIVDIVVVFFPFSYAVLWIFFFNHFFFSFARSLAHFLSFMNSVTPNCAIVRYWNGRLIVFLCLHLGYTLSSFRIAFHLFILRLPELQFVHRLNLLAFHYFFNEIWPSLSMFHTTGT